MGVFESEAVESDACGAGEESGASLVEGSGCAEEPDGMILGVELV